MKVYDPHWTERCRAHLMLFENYSLDLPLWFGARPQNSRFRPTWTCLILEVLASRKKLLQSSGYCTVISYAFIFRATNAFVCSRGCPVWTRKAYVSNKITLHIHIFAFKLYTEWNNAQHVRALTTTILWCNSYRHRIWTRRYEFKSWTRLIAFHIALIPLRKVWIQIFSLQLWVNSRTD